MLFKKVAAKLGNKVKKNHSILTSHHEGKKGTLQNQVKAKVFARLRSPHAVSRAPYLYIAHRRAQRGEPLTMPDTV
jgi:hypothetical protein